MTDAEVLTKHGIPQPPGEVIQARYHMGRLDWYAETEAGWYWWSGKEWLFCPMGPM